MTYDPVNVGPERPGNIVHGNLGPLEHTFGPGHIGAWEH